MSAKKPAKIGHAGGTLAPSKPTSEKPQVVQVPRLISG